MSKLRSHLTYANVGVTVALVLATTGFAVASIPGRGGVISACYRKMGGGLRVIDTAKKGSAGKCTKKEKSLSWNQRGQRGLQGAQGAQGPPGTPDTSQFYTKTDSDARFLHGSGAITTISPATVAAGTISPLQLIDLPGTGKVTLSCAIVNTAINYTNESGATQSFAFMSGHTANTNSGGAAETGTVTAGSAFGTTNLNNNDLLRLSLANGTKTIDFTIAVFRNGSNCVAWGEVYSG